MQGTTFSSGTTAEVDGNIHDMLLVGVRGPAGCSSPAYAPHGKWHLSCHCNTPTTPQPGPSQTILLSAHTFG
jgi:hypothetical protein